MTAELIILGMLWRRPAHPYELVRVARDWRLDEFTPLALSSLYRVLAALERRGLVRVEERRVGSRPTRRVYSLTEAGLARLRELVRGGIQPTSLEGPRAAVHAALLFADVLPRHEVRAVLRARLDGTRSTLAALDTAAKRACDAPPVGSPYAAIIRLRGYQHLRAEVAWLQQALMALEREDTGGNRD